MSAVLEATASTDANLFLEENAKWHTALATASHNELLFALAAAIFPLLMEASGIKRVASEEICGVAVRAHRRILQAIEERAAETARRRADRDVQAYGKYLEAAVAAARARGKNVRIRGSKLDLSRTLAASSGVKPAAPPGIRSSVRSWRREWDSNPRYAFSAHTLSKRAP